MEQKNVNNFFRSYKKIWFKKDFGYTNCVKEILVVKYFEQKNMQVHKDFMVQNKPSFCSGSCDKIHATKKLQNKTSMKDS